MYTPPAKRQRISSSPNPPSSPPDTSLSSSPPQEDPKRTHRETDTRRNDKYRHSKPRHNVRSHDQRRRSHRQPQDPSKWTKYDLRNDGTEHLAGLSAEKANRQVAYQFLNELKKSNQTKEEDLQDTKDTKIVFKRPARSRDHSDSEDKLVEDTESSKERQDSVRVMPEYVVGVSGGRKRQQNKTGSGCGSNSDRTNMKTKTSIVLSHLEECDD